MAEETFRALADGAPVMMWRADVHKRLDWFNRCWLDFVGRSADLGGGAGAIEGVHPDDVERRRSQFDSAFDARQSFSIQYRLRRIDGEYRWLLENGAPYQLGGRFAGYSGSCVDVTELVRLRAQTDVLVSELNHRVKNNMQTIIALLAFSAGRARGDEARSLLASAIRRIQGVGVVQEHLHKSGADAVDLARYLASVARSVTGAETERTIALRIEAEPVMSSFPQASSLGIILTELVANAMRHARQSGGEIQIRLQRLEKGLAEILVTDNGPGFDRGMLESPSSTSRRKEGLVDALARHAKATVSRDNHDGAQVRLRFPVA